MRKSYLSARFKNRFISALFLLIIAAPLQSTLLAQSLSTDGTVPVIERDDMIIAPAPDMGNICKLSPTDINRNYFKKNEISRHRVISKARSSRFEVEYINSCSNGSQWQPEAIRSFEYALGIWENYLESSVPIRIRADWVSLQCDSNGCTLGSAGPTRIVQLTGAVPDTWYTIAQASAMTGQDIVESIEDEEHDIRISMNCNFNNWYFGTDASTPTGLIDFVTVVLHEVGHGIGFIGSMNADNDSESGSYGFGSANLPIIYDRFTEDGAGIPLLNTSSYSNPSNNLYQALTGQRGGVFFTGINAQSIFNGQRVPLYAPSEWNGGSSYSHLDKNVFSQRQNLASALMRPSIDSQFAVHSPGPVFCGMLSDWGWPVNVSCQDLVENNSEIAILEGDLEEQDNFYLYDFGVNDVGDKLELNFDVTNITPTSDSLYYVLSIAGDENNFKISENSEYEVKVGPGVIENVTLLYEPEDDGIHEVDLNFYHNSSGISNPLIVRIRAEAYFDNFIIIDSEVEIDFKATNVGRPIERQFEIKNADEANSSLSYEVSVTNTNFRIGSGHSLGTLEPGESNIISVFFDPISDQIHEGNIIVDHNSGNLPNPFTIDIKGEALRENEVARLENNYPNPFNPNTTIPYVLPETSNVRLDVFNVSGQLVQTLVNEQQSEGRYELQFEASQLSSGIYFYRLMVNNFADTKKFMLIK